MLLILVFCSLYAYQWQLGAEEVGALQRRLGLRPAAVLPALGSLAEGDGALDRLGAVAARGVLPLLTYQLVHGGGVHLLANVLFFWVFGGRLEARSSWLRFLAFHLLVGAAAGAAELAWEPERSAPTVGASGAVAGTMAAYLALHGRARVLMVVPAVVVPVLVELPAVALAGAWLALQIRPVQQLLAMGPAEPITFAAHGGGALAGLLLAPLLLRRPRMARSR